MASLEIGTPSRPFSLAISLPFALVGGFQGTRGALANHELPNQKFANIHQLFYINKIDKSKTFGQRIWNKVCCYHKHIEDLWRT
jgi:hypothetical protein